MTISEKTRDIIALHNLGLRHSDIGRYFGHDRRVISNLIRHQKREKRAKDETNMNDAIEILLQYERIKRQKREVDKKYGL